MSVTDGFTDEPKPLFAHHSFFFLTGVCVWDLLSSFVQSSMKEPSNYVINYFKLHAAVFLLKLEDSNTLGLFKDPEGGEVVRIWNLKLLKKELMEMNPDGLLHENVFIL